MLLCSGYLTNVAFPTTVLPTRCSVFCYILSNLCCFLHNIYWYCLQRLDQPLVRKTLPDGSSMVHFISLHVTKLQHIYIIHMARCETAFCVFINCVLWCYSCKQLLGKTLFSPSSSSCKVNWLLLQQQPHSQFNGFARLLLQTAGVRGSQMVAMVGDTADAESIIALKYSSVFTFVKVFIYSLIKYYLLDAWFIGFSIRLIKY